jgi:hypothetical protein
MITAWLARRREVRKVKSETEFTLKRDGCVCYCRECKGILNGHGDWIDEIRCQFRCPCGMVSIFGFFAPVPVLLSCSLDEHFPPKDVIPILP